MKKHAVYFTVNTLTQTHAYMHCLLNTFHSVVSSFPVKKTSIRFLEVLNFKNIFKDTQLIQESLSDSFSHNSASQSRQTIQRTFYSTVPEATLYLRVLNECRGDGGQSKKKSGF